MLIGSTHFRLAAQAGAGRRPAFPRPAALRADQQRAFSILPMERSGTVIRVSRKGAVVRLPPGAHGEPESLWRCSLGGRLFGRGDPRPEGAAAVVGDEVLVEEIEPGRRQAARPGTPSGRITAVLPRKNALRRAVGPPERREMRIFAANLDRCYIVSAFVEPPYRTGFVDRSLVVAFDAGVTPVLVFNKLDLADEADIDKLAQDLVPYRRLELEVHRTSTRSGAGIDSFRTGVAGGRAVLFGHSGVGKTELLAALGVPGRRSGGLDRRGRGRHTTTAAELIRLPGGGEIVDTPGIRALGLDGLTEARIRAAHPDLACFSDDCRFPDCSHRTEPDCAVQAAVTAGKADPARYESLIRLSREAGGLSSLWQNPRGVRPAMHPA